MKYIVTQDESCHWYVIPADKECHFNTWLWSEEDSSVPIPDYAERINGHPSRITFTDYEITK